MRSSKERRLRRQYSEKIIENPDLDESLYVQTEYSMRQSVQEFDTVTKIPQQRGGRNTSIMSNKSIRSQKLQPIKEDDEEEKFDSGRHSGRIASYNNEVLLKNYKVDLDIEKYKINKKLTPEYENISNHLRSVLDKLCEEKSQQKQKCAPAVRSSSVESLNVISKIQDDRKYMSQTAQRLQYPTAVERSRSSQPSFDQYDRRAPPVDIQTYNMAQRTLERARDQRRIPQEVVKPYGEFNRPQTLPPQPVVSYMDRTPSHRYIVPVAPISVTQLSCSPRNVIPYSPIKYQSITVSPNPISKYQTSKVSPVLGQSSPVKSFVAPQTTQPSMVNSSTSDFKSRFAQQQLRETQTRQEQTLSDLCKVKEDLVKSKEELVKVMAQNKELKEMVEEQKKQVEENKKQAEEQKKYNEKMQTEIQNKVQDQLKVKEDGEWQRLSTIFGLELLQTDDINQTRKERMSQLIQWIESMDNGQKSKLEQQIENLKNQNEINKNEAVKIMNEMKTKRVKNEQEIQKQFMDLYLKFQEMEAQKDLLLQTIDSKKQFQESSNLEFDALFSKLKEQNLQLKSQICTLQKNETKDELLIHSLKQVINLQKKFIPVTLEQQIDKIVEQTTTDMDLMNQSLQSLLEQSHAFSEKTFQKMDESYFMEEDFKSEEIKQLQEELKQCKEVMVKMKERMNKTEKFYVREKQKKYRNCGSQINMDKPATASRKKSKDNSYVRQKTFMTDFQNLEQSYKMTDLSQSSQLKETSEFISKSDPRKSKHFKEISNIPHLVVVDESDTQTNLILTQDPKIRKDRDIEQISFTIDEKSIFKYQKENDYKM